MQLFVNGVASDVSLDSDGLRWSPSFEDAGLGVESNTSSNGQGLFFCFPMLEASAVHVVPFKEMLCAERLLEPKNSSTFLSFSNFLQSAISSTAAPVTFFTNNSSTDVAKPLLYGFSIHTFSRSPSKPSEWHPLQIDIESENEELVEQLLSEISNCISAASTSRPTRVLIILNPNAGSGAAQTQYRTILQPLLSKAGISAKVVETERAGHAMEVVVEAVSGKLEFDGIVAVGGDGIFHEVLNGVLEATLSNKNKTPRLAHIPCGSTDAVACSLHGCRSVFTAAMHMALGDSTPLDALKVSIGGTVRRFACCIATYGFMGDVVQESEHHRWLGPLRYDIIGAMKILNNQSYHCRVSYLPPPETAAAGANTLNTSINEEDKSVCVANCSICRAASIASSSSSIVSTSQHQYIDTNSRGNSTNWTVLEGEWMSIMLIVQPCRSDKTPHGMARYGHLNDGRFTLVLVRRCSPLCYLKFLATMSSSGLAPGLMPGVLEVIDAVACKVECTGDDGSNKVRSHWNIDGEIVHGGGDGGECIMEAHAQLGAVNCFARGVEV
jgi:ceramide kinase